MDIVFSCVIPYIQDGADRNSFSLVCRAWYELDCLTREELTIQLFYATKLSSRLSKRFPFIKYLHLKGLEFRALDEPLLDVTVWIKEIVSTFDYLEELYLAYVQVGDENLELLAKTRGKQLRKLWIIQCDKFSTDGLKHICRLCFNLRTLSIVCNQIITKDAEWLHELALHNTCIECLICFGQLIIDFDVNDLTLLAKNCSQSLKRVIIASEFGIVDLKDFFNSAVMLQDFVGCDLRAKKGDYDGFKFPPNMKCMEFKGFSKDELGIVVPFAHQLTELHLYEMEQDDQDFLLERCPNLEDLYVNNINGNNGLLVISRFCKNLRKVNIYDKSVSYTGLITLAQGCLELEHLKIKLEDISDEAMECLGANLKNLRAFHMTSLDMNRRNLLPANGIQALLIGCTKLEQLSIKLVHRRLTRLGMEYIGEYGHELRHLSLTFTGIHGFKKLSKGCPKLRELKLKDCQFSNEEILSFVFNNITSLRYIYVWNEKDEQYMTKTRPNFELVLL